MRLTVCAILLVQAYYERASDTFVVRDGQIVAQSFTTKLTPKN